MYEPDGNEYILLIEGDDGIHHRLLADDEDMARWINAGMKIISEERIFREPLPDPETAMRIIQEANNANG